jgi:hypothetical protein
MHLRRLIVLIINARNFNSAPPSCKWNASIIGIVCSAASLQRFLIGQIKLTRFHVHDLCLPRGAGSNGTEKHLFTMSKDPPTNPSRH